jgi:hypothetical protein
MPSYNTALAFLVKHNDGVHGKPGYTVGLGTTGPGQAWNPPDGYAVKVTKVGNPSRKIFIADGAKYIDSLGSPPNEDLTRLGQSVGAAFADQGACSYYSRSWYRGYAPGNGLAAGQGQISVDPRLWAYRHGVQKSWLPANEYKFSAGFFDGHVELLGDLEGAEPSLWLPKGTTTIIRGEMWNDVQTHYYPNIAGATVTIQ